MYCIDLPRASRPRGWLGGVALALLLAGCVAPPQTAPPAAPVPPAAGPAPAPATPAAAAPLKLPAPGTPRSLADLRRQAAERIVAANPGRTYAGKVPDILLAIPVLEIELHADGSIRRIEVLREPRQAKDTTQLAIDAVRRAAPFGDVSRLPRPWKFTETFLFDDDRRFKPRTLNP